MKGLSGIMTVKFKAEKERGSIAIGLAPWCCPQGIALAIWRGGSQVTSPSSWVMPMPRSTRRRNPKKMSCPWHFLVFWRLFFAHRNFQLRWFGEQWTAQDEHPYTSRESSAPDVVENDSSDYRCGFSCHWTYSKHVMAHGSQTPRKMTPKNF